MAQQFDLHRSDDYFLMVRVIAYSSKPNPPNQIITMPRLLGKPSKAPVYLVIALLAAVASVAVLEYSGTIDLIPGFGQDQRTTKRLEKDSGSYLAP